MYQRRKAGGGHPFRYPVILRSREGDRYRPLPGSHRPKGHLAEILRALESRQAMCHVRRCESSRRPNATVREAGMLGGLAHGCFGLFVKVKHDLRHLLVDQLYIYNYTVSLSMR